MIKGDVMFFASAIPSGEIVAELRIRVINMKVSTFALHKDLKIF
jgi:hypothetical protein